MKNFYSIGVLLMLAACPVLAAGPKAVACLSDKDAVGCFTAVAAAALVQERSAESRLEGYADLLSTMAKIGVRKDDIFFAASDDDSAPVYSRWTLALARKTYSFQFGIEDKSGDSPQRIEMLGNFLRRRSDGLERLFIVWNACEARESVSPEALARWEGTLDRLCKLDESDIQAIESMSPDFSSVAALFIHAYNRNEEALRRLNANVDIIFAGYEKALRRKMPAAERKAILGALAYGHFMRAAALAIAGNGSGSVRAIEMALDYFKRSPDPGKAIGGELILATTSLVYGKAGLRDKSMKTLKKAAARIDRAKNMHGGDKALALSGLAETLSVLQHR
jgi:hypothetical protein